MARSNKMLIEELVADAAPVSRLWPTGARLAVWMAALGAFGAAVASDAAWPVGAQGRSASLAPELVAAVAGTLTWAALALQAAVPGRAPSRVRIAVGIAVALSPILFWRPAPGPVPFVATVLACALRTAVLALGPSIATLWAVRRGAPLATRSAAALSGGAGFLAAYLLMRVLCTIDQPAHLLVGHAVPVALGIGVAAAVGGSWLGRWRRRTPL